VSNEELGPEERGLRPAGGPVQGGSPGQLVRMGLFFYGAMAAVALIWRTGIYGEPILYASPQAAAAGVAIWSDVLVGLLAGGLVIAVSHQVSARTEWGEQLARALGSALGFLRVPDAVLLALASGIAEEMLFRGALQPRVGWLVASVVFGLVHFVPRREFLPWTAFAVLAGLLFGGLFALTGNLVAPVTAHFVVNAVNLPVLVRRYGGATPEA